MMNKEIQYSGSIKILKPIKSFFLCIHLYIISFVVSYPICQLRDKGFQNTFNITKTHSLFIFALIGALSWFYGLCVSAHQYHVMTSQSDWRKFLVNGKRIIFDVLFLGMFQIILYWLVMTVYTGIFEATGINYSDYKTIMVSMLYLTVYALIAYMMPLILLGRFHKEDGLDFSNTWSTKGPKFLVQNIVPTLQIIFMLLICAIVSRYLVVYFTDNDPSRAAVIKGLASFLTSLIYAYVEVFALHVVLSKRYQFASRMSGMCELIVSSDYDEAQAISMILKRANIVFKTSSDLKDMEEGKTGSIKFYVNDNQIWDEANRLIKDHLSDE